MQLKDFDAPHLVQYMEGGSYWLHGLSDRSMYLGKGMFDSLSTEGTTDNNAGLGSGHWYIIKAQAADALLE